MIEAPAKTLGKPWRKGQSGNPTGRPPGVLSWDQKHREALRKASPKLIAKLKKIALAGDVQALRFLIERVLPVHKATAPPVLLPEVESAEGFADKARAVVDAVARGELAVDLGASLVNAITDTARVVEIDEIVRRLEALEGKNAG